MYDLIPISEKTYYIDCPAKMGIYQIDDKNVYLIDSGNDKEAGKKVLKILNEKDWNLKAIINTHSNADHIGGNHLLQQRTGCKIYANAIEAAFTKYPLLEPSFLFGAYPPKELRNKFLMAASSDVLDITDESFPRELEVIPLEGHFFHMIGLKTPDNVVFLADCISSENTINKYQISFIYNVEQYLDTLNKVETMQANYFVPAHAEVTSNIKSLVEINRKKVFEIMDKLLKDCEQPYCFEELLQKVFTDYNLTMDFNQYVLVGSTIRSYLSYLKDNKKLTALFEQNKLLWKTI